MRELGLKDKSAIKERTREIRDVLRIKTCFDGKKMCFPEGILAYFEKKYVLWG